MRLTVHTDYSLRVLIYLAASQSGRSSIGEIAAAYGISRNHLMKIVHQLGQGGFIHTVRGRGGGFSLARPADHISVGEVVRFSEADLRLADCEHCAIRERCGMIDMFGEATRAFLAVLDRHSIADAIRDKAWMSNVWRMMQTGER